MRKEFWRSYSTAITTLKNQNTDLEKGIKICIVKCIEMLISAQKFSREPARRKQPTREKKTEISRELLSAVAIVAEEISALAESEAVANRTEDVEKICGNRAPITGGSQQRDKVEGLIILRALLLGHREI